MANRTSERAELLSIIKRIKCVDIIFIESQHTEYLLRHFHGEVWAKKNGEKTRLYYPLKINVGVNNLSVSLIYLTVLILLGLGFGRLFGKPLINTVLLFG